MIEKELETLNPTKWDIYNAITKIATHERIGETVREHMERVSEKILSPAYTIMPMVVA